MSLIFGFCNIKISFVRYLFSTFEKLLKKYYQKYLNRDPDLEGFRTKLN